MSIFHEKIQILDKKFGNSTSSKNGHWVTAKKKKKKKKKKGWVNEPEIEFKKGINVVNNYPRHQF